jgi:uncharacterized protein YciI
VIREDAVFVVIVSYLVPLQRIQRGLAEHLAWLDQHYRAGLFLASGPRVPRAGGIILAKGTTKDELRRLLQQDPFSMRGYADYTVLQFTPSKTAPGFADLLA